MKTCVSLREEKASKVKKRGRRNREKGGKKSGVNKRRR